MQVTLLNSTKDSIYYVPKSHLPAIKISLTRRDKPVDLTKFGTIHFSEGLIVRDKGQLPVELKPGQSVHTVLNLTRYYDLSIPGDYQMTAGWSGFIALFDKPIAIKTNPSDFSVVVTEDESTSIIPNNDK